LAVRSVAVAPDGSPYAVSAGQNESIRVWNIESGAEEGSPGGIRDLARAVTVTPDGQSIVAGGDDGNIRVFDLGTGEELRTLTGHKSEVQSVAVTPDGRHIVSGGEDGMIRVWSTP